MSATINTLQGSLNDRLIKSTANQTHIKGGIAALKEQFDKSGITPKNSYTLEAIFRTQTAIAYSAGYHQTMQNPAVDEILWGYEYTTVGDDRVRPAHVAMDGTRLPKDDNWWNTHTPPCGFACRCTLIPIFKGDRQASLKSPAPKKINGMLVYPDADTGFATNWANTFKNVLPRQANPAQALTAAHQTKKYKQRMAVFMDKATDTEKKDVNAWANEDYQTIRAADTGNTSNVIATAQLETLRKMMRKMPNWRGTVYRGLGVVGAGEFAKLTSVGNIYSEEALASTSKSLNRAQEYIHHRTAFSKEALQSERNVLLEIHTVGGKDISGLSNVPSDQEVLITKSQKYKIESIRETGESVFGHKIKYTHVVVRQIK